MLFPDHPTPEHPLRHTLCIGLLSDDDLIMIVDSINAYLDGK